MSAAPPARVSRRDLEIVGLFSDDKATEKNLREEAQQHLRGGQIKEARPSVHFNHNLLAQSSSINAVLCLRTKKGPKAEVAFCQIGGSPA
jgi:hypothetical protein